MPELPEVETTCRGLRPHLEGGTIKTAIVRNRALRQPIPRNLPALVANTTVRALRRRGKYLLMDCGKGTLILHLGMSGRLWLVPPREPAQKHDHFDLVMVGGVTVRLRDPRRFGLVLWHKGDVSRHPLLARLGPEPLEPGFDGDWLYRHTRNRGCAIKLALMDSRLVAGIGNIYASEALFRAGISPRIAARRTSLARCQLLAEKIRETLQRAIRAGGSSLRDYVDSHGMAGNFQNEFLVYDRAGQACVTCNTPVRLLLQGQRSTYYCPRCQR